MEKIWLQQYPKGVPAEINPDAYPSVVEVVEHSFKEFSSNIAYENMGCRITYSQLDEMSEQFAGYLQSMGLEKGDRVALMMPNLLQYPICLFGILRAGMTVVNVNPLYTARELTHQLKDAGAKAIVVLQNFAHVLQKSLPDTDVEHVVVTQIGDSFPFIKRLLINTVVKHVKKMVPSWQIDHAVPLLKALKLGGQAGFTREAVTGEDVAFLQYTGGTTGVAKGAVLTHRNMVSNLEQASAWLTPFLSGDQEIIITALPLYHIFSLTANCLTFMKAGAKNVLITNPRDIPGFVKELNKHQFTTITGVNTLFNALLNHPDFAKLDFTRLKIALGGGMAVQHAVAEKWEQVTGRPLFEAYGLTETSPAVTINPLDLTHYNASIGLPVPSTEVSIRDEDGNEVGINEEGELCVRGPQVMRGYWNRPKETANVFLPDNWLCTGDMAKVDEKGFVFILERKKDMVLVSGFNVYPNEVEDVLVSHPGITEAAVIGVPHHVTGEVLKAFVVLSDVSVTKEDIISHCRENLTNYKVPKLIEFRDELPKTNVGKILRRALRDEAK